MKNTLIITTLTATLITGCSPDYSTPIHNALAESQTAVQLSKVYDPLTPQQVAYEARTGKHIAQRYNPVKSAQAIADKMRMVDVTKCPEDFRLEWIHTIHALENYNPTANAAHTAAATAIGIEATRTGSKALGDATARQIEETATLSDIKASFQQLETIATKYSGPR